MLAAGLCANGVGLRGCVDNCLARGGDGEGDIPPEEEIRAAFKKETGRDPTPKELEEFKAQAAGPEPEGDFFGANESPIEGLDADPFSKPFTEEDAR